MEVKIDIQTLLTIIEIVGIAGILAFVFLLLVYFWDKIEKFSSSLAKLITSFSKSGEAEILRLSLQSELNSAVSSVADEVPGLFNKGVRVRWLNAGDEHINAGRRGIFIRIRKNEDTDTLFLKSLNLLLENDLLVNSRPYIHGHVFEGIKLVLTEKVLSKVGLRSATIAFRREKYTPTISQDRSIAKATNQLEFLDYRGLFTRVFLRECSDLYERVGVGHESSKPRWDVSRFLEFSNSLFRALDTEGIRASFEYTSDTLNIAFAVLADEYTWATGGIGFYQKRTKLSIQRGANTIYVVALGARNIKMANGLASWLQSEGFLDKKYISYYRLAFGRNNNVPAVCIKCDIRASAKKKLADGKSDSYADIILNDPDLHELVRSVVPDPEIEIIQSAWLKGYQAQVVVYSKNPRKNVLQTCIGKNGANGRELQKTTGDYVRFIQWSPDIREAILNNLDNHEREEVDRVMLEPGNRIAYVFVKSSKTVAGIVGKNAQTLKLAEAITEYAIEIQVDTKSKITEQLNEFIPEIAMGDIIILDLAIFVDMEIRILVTSEKYDSPASVCGGYIDDLKSHLNIAERIYFCNKKDRMEESIIAALYPLKSEDVIKVIKDSPLKYTVVVRDADAMARGIGTDGAHVRTAGQLLGVWIQLALPQEVKQ